MDLHLLKLLTAEVLVLITIVHLALVMAVPTGREEELLHPCLVVEDTVVAGRGATEVVIEAITAILEAHLGAMEVHQEEADMGEVAAVVVAMEVHLEATILMVTKEAADMAAAEVATIMVAPADLEEEEAGVTVEAAVTLEAEEAVVEVLAAAPEEAMEAVMEDHLVDMEAVETKSSPTIKSM